jgi:nucleotide-binding universal stress UspA family protein
MFDKILVCLDGSPLAEKILPLAQTIAGSKGSRVVLLRVVENSEELLAEESYMRARASVLGASIRFLISSDPAIGIVEELEKNPRAMAAMTTHGRTAWGEALLGSVAQKVVRGAKRPVLLYRARPDNSAVPATISTLIVAVDGSEFSEKIIPAAVEVAKSLNSRITLVQALPAESAAQAARANIPLGDVLESSYLQTTAAEIKKRYQIEPSWDVLHGEAGDAICRYVNGMKDTLLAMTSHARGGVERVVFGSVAAACIRKAGVPMLIYWPEH